MEQLQCKAVPASLEVLDPHRFNRPEVSNFDVPK